jgi:tetratricopeptide (TPR) repeat protein
MGKTWLINKMGELAENHPKLKCGCVRYEVTPTDSVDSTMALMIDNAFDGAHIEEGSFSGTDRRLEQWRSLLNIVNLGDLVMSLRRDPAKNTRQQFLERLQLISKHMPKNGRAIFVVDPEKYMQKDSDQAWAIVVKGLPDKIKMIFAQRTEDVLVESATFAALDNISRIPEKSLGVLEEQAVDELLDRRVAGMDYTVAEVRKILSKYKGHPYALQGALDLLETGTELQNLPEDPTGIAAAQWKELCKRGKDAIRLFKAYAILEVGVPDDVVAPVSGLDSDTRQGLPADSYLGGLLREEEYGKRIYHAILADYIVEQISDAEKKQYHSRAVQVYREKLKDAREKQTAPDALAATRLAEHALAAGGVKAFVVTFIDESGEALISLGLLDVFRGFSERALEVVERGSTEEAAIFGDLGVICQKRGDLDKAEQMHIKALEIDEKLGRLEGLANQYGNLGVVYRSRCDLDKAEQMLTKALEISERLGWLVGMANGYAALALVYHDRGDLAKAEEMHLRGLEVEERIRRPEGIARQYGNLGAICRTRGDLDKAEQMHVKALEINEKLGRLEGMASNYGNLGKVYEERGDIKKAREHWEKALGLFKKIGMKPEIDKVEGWLDGLKDR